MTPDLINGLFEAIGGLLVLNHCRVLFVDKMVKGVSVFSTTSPVSQSNIAIVCCAACKSQPIIFISASFDPSAVRVDATQSTRPSRGRRRYDISLRF